VSSRRSLVTCARLARPDPATHPRIPSHAQSYLARCHYSHTLALLSYSITHLQYCSLHHLEHAQHQTPTQNPSLSTSFRISQNDATVDLSYRDANVVSSSPSYSLPLSTPPPFRTLFKDISALYLPFRHPLSKFTLLFSRVWSPCRHHSPCSTVCLAATPYCICPFACCLLLSRRRYLPVLDILHSILI